jgi:uncharacterized protein (DUF2141 family)
MHTLILTLLSLFISTDAAPVTKLNVEITNLKSAKGKLWIAMFRPDEKFGGDKPSIFKIIPVQSASNQTVDFELEPGKYALAVYHDLNNNSVLDKNFVGIPKEPYGFSNDFRPRFSPPTFEDCAFELSASGKKIIVKLTN